MSGNVPAIKLMIENGIQINHIDKDKHSAVHWTVVCGQVSSIKSNSFQFISNVKISSSHIDMGRFSRGIFT